MLTFVIGPSRAGKSTLLKKIAGQFPDVAFVNLDDAIEKIERRLTERGITHLGGWLEKWGRAFGIFNRADDKKKDTVFDVGAGALQTREAFEYFDQCVHSVILIIAPFETILKRHEGRDPGELRRTELSPAHVLLHQKITRRMDTSALSEDRSAEKLLGSLKAAYLEK